MAKKAITSDKELHRKLCEAAGLTWCEEHQAPRWFGKFTCLLLHDDEQARIAREWQEHANA